MARVICSLYNVDRHELELVVVRESRASRKPIRHASKRVLKQKITTARFLISTLS